MRRIVATVCASADAPDADSIALSKISDRERSSGARFTGTTPPRVHAPDQSLAQAARTTTRCAVATFANISMTARSSLVALCTSSTVDSTGRCRAMLGRSRPRSAAFNWSRSGRPSSATAAEQTSGIAIADPDSRVATSYRKRVLPIPGSASISAAAPVPDFARVTSWRTALSCATRPTNGHSGRSASDSNDEGR